MSKCVKCGSYAFNLYKEDIDQGGLCDVHYWQYRAHRAEALAEQPAQDDPDLQDKDPELVEQHYKQVIDGVREVFDAKRKQQPAQQQEPVALETVYETIIQWDEGGGKRSRRELARRIVDLYTSPPAQRTWVGLTDEDLKNCTVGGAADARKWEAKLKEKNT